MSIHSRIHSVSRDDGMGNVGNFVNLFKVSRRGAKRVDHELDEYYECVWNGMPINL